MLLEDLIDSVKIETLSNLIEKNRELVEMKYNDFDSNVTFGRTLSLGQWFGLYLGSNIAKELNDYEVLIDTCITTLKQYKVKKEDSNKIVRKNRYPDILIVKKIIEDSLESYTEFIEENKKTIIKLGLENITTINIYDTVAVIEVKIDPGYIKTNDLSTSFAELNDYLKSREEFSFKKIYKKDTDEEFFLKNVVRFNSHDIKKYLVLATEANHSDRVPEIKQICTKEDFNFISLTNHKKHIRNFKTSDIPNLKNLI